MKIEPTPEYFEPETTRLRRVDVPTRTVEGTITEGSNAFVAVNAPPDLRVVAVRMVEPATLQMLVTSGTFARLEPDPTDRNDAFARAPQIQLHFKRPEPPAEPKLRTGAAVRVTVEPGAYSLSQMRDIIAKAMVRKRVVRAKPKKKAAGNRSAAAAKRAGFVRGRKRKPARRTRGERF